MAKEHYVLTPQNIAHIGSIDFVTDAEGNLSKINVTCEINYGVEGRVITVDLLPELTETQRKNAQNFYSNLKAKLEKVILE